MPMVIYSGKQSTYSLVPTAITMYWIHIRMSIVKSFIWKFGIVYAEQMCGQLCETQLLPAREPALRYLCTNQLVSSIQVIPSWRNALLMQLNLWVRICGKSYHFSLKKTSHHWLKNNWMWQQDSRRQNFQAGQGAAAAIQLLSCGSMWLSFLTLGADELQSPSEPSRLPCNSWEMQTITPL